MSNPYAAFTDGVRCDAPPKYRNLYPSLQCSFDHCDAQFGVSAAAAAAVAAAPSLSSPSPPLISSSPPPSLNGLHDLPSPVPSVTDDESPPVAPPVAISP